MKRREFLKAVTGIVAIPTICTTTLSKNINTFNNNTGINFDNIKTTGTFDQWIESIRTEIQRMLVSKNHGDNTYSVEIKSSNWGTKKDPVPAKAIVIMYTGIVNLTTFVFPREMTYFSFAKCEFKRAKANPKWLKSLVTVRFVNMQWSLEDQRERYFKLLRRFDPKHETSGDYLH